jgi:hypothetical protein
MGGPPHCKGNSAWLTTGRLVVCSHVFGLLMQRVPLALMKSADRNPNLLSALNGAWSRRVDSIPGLTGSSSRLTILARLPCRSVSAGEEICLTGGCHVALAKYQHDPGNPCWLVCQRYGRRSCWLAFHELHRPTRTGVLRPCKAHDNCSTNNKKPMDIAVGQRQRLRNCVP